MPTPAVDSPGNNQAFVDAPSAPTFPVVIDATHNEINFNSVAYQIDQYGSRKTGTTTSLPVTIDSTHKTFNFNSVAYTIATGVYKDLFSFAKAVNAALAGATRFDSLVLVSPVAGCLRFDSRAHVSLLAFATGSSNDCIAKLGLSNADAMAAVGYPDLVSLKNAVNGALLVSDGVTRLDSVVTASISPFVPTKLRFTKNAAGVSTLTFATGSSNDCVTRLGLTNGTALANGAAANSPGTTFDTTLTSNQAPSAATKVAGNADPLVWTAVPALQASWATKTGYQAAQYSKDRFGIVRLRGVIDTGTKTAGTLITTLPAGYRPQAKQVFSTTAEVAATSNNAGTLIIDTDGTVKVGETALTASSYITFDSIIFDSVS